ncbi:molybdopterin-dependent oxidoreductase [Acuticoccus sediminis]|nr:molybdopterin-dependent oxidoreductase [Acuticoccus sediminis]
MTTRRPHSIDNDVHPGETTEASPAIDPMVLNSAHWGVFRVASAAGRPIAIVPFERDPKPSPLLEGMVEAYDHPTRIARPAVRKGWLERGPADSRRERGADPFVEVPWDEALDLVAAELARVKKDHGNSAIFGGSYGWSSAGRFHHAKTQVKRFLNTFGGAVGQVNNYSFGAGMVLLPHVLGSSAMLFGVTTGRRSIAANTELFLAFGGMPSRNTQIESGGPGEHRQESWLRELGKRCRIVNVSPLADDVEGIGSEWWPAIPGTDTALILGLCHTLLAEGLADEGFLASHCHGYDAFAQYLREGRSGASFDADWAATITGFDADRIRTLARDLARSRSFIALSWSLQRADHGEDVFWAAVALAAMLGQIGLPGGGVGFGYGSLHGIGNEVAPFCTPRLDAGANPVGMSIPVARIADLLLGPGARLDYDGSAMTLPKIRLVYWAGGNPFHHHQDLNRLVDAFRQPETVIVHETHWTATARRADIVLPATTTIERDDIGASSTDRYLVSMRRAVDPYAEARDDYAIFTALAARLGIEERFTEGRSDAEWLRHMYEETRHGSALLGVELPDYETFRAQEFAEIAQPPEPVDALAAFRADPQGQPLDTPSGRIELFSETIAGFGYPDCGGHPMWRTPREWLGGPLAERFPLALISNQPAHRLHGQLDPVGVSKATKIAGREPIRLHPEDARARGVRDGDIVRVFNDRGACLAGVVVSDALRQGVVQMATGAWYDPLQPEAPGGLDVHGNPNVLTHDHGTSTLSRGPAPGNTLVEVEPYRAPPPPITVDRPPQFVPDPRRSGT